MCVFVCVCVCVTCVFLCVCVCVFAESLRGDGKCDVDTLVSDQSRAPDPGRLITEERMRGMEG